MSATTSTNVEQLYADIVQDLVPYYMDAVLLPNQQIILNSLNVSGSTGDQVRFPLMNTYDNAVTITEGTSIIGTAGAESNLIPTAANVTFDKRGLGVDVTEESLEDGGFDMVRNGVLSRLSGGIAQATDVAGLATCKSEFVNNDGVVGANATVNASLIANFIMSPEALAYAAKREPVVKVWYNPNKDVHEFRATVRNGFTALRGQTSSPTTPFGRRIHSASLGSGLDEANVQAIATSVANLRSVNAPVGSDGMYIGLIDPAFELAINKQIAGVGGTTISSLSDLGNNALRNAALAMVAGATLYRSNNLPNAS
jgi:hypothetical protein